MPDCTIVIPCYNEADRLDLPAIIRHATSHDHRLLFVNDGSSDVTGEILDDLVAADPDHIAALHLPENGGKAEAVRQGILRACEGSPRYVGYWDADLATPLAAIDEFAEYLEANRHVNILLGARVRLLGRQIHRRAARHCLGRLFAIAAAATLRLPVYDTQCGAKLLRAGARIRSLFEQPFLTKWLFDVELLARYLTMTPESGVDRVAEDTIHEFPLSHWRDVDGSKVKTSDFVRGVWQLAVIYRTYRPGTRPLAVSDASNAAAQQSSETTTSPRSSHRSVVERERATELNGRV